MNTNNKPQEKKLGLWLAIIAIIIALGALIISSLSFYYQHIRQINDVKATILKFSPNNSLESAFLSSIVFVNNGNKPASIYEIWVTVRYPNVEASTGDQIVCWDEEDPFTINPGEVVTRQILFGRNTKMDYLEILRYFKGISKKKGINIGITFFLLDSFGRPYKIEIPVLVLNKFDKNGEPISWRCPLGLPLTKTLLQ